MSDIDLSKPSPEGLSYLLRHKELWPEGFKWDYYYASRCAIGLHRSFWKNFNYRYVDMLPGSTTDKDKVFFFLELNENKRTITPEHVADAIDQLLKKVNGNV